MRMSCIVAKFFCFCYIISMEGLPDNSQSRQERREARRLQQRASDRAQGRRRSMRRLAIWGIGIAMLFGLGWVMVKLASRVQLPQSGGGLVVEVSASDNILGPADAPVTLVEYSDFQCPACAAFYPIIKQAMAEASLKDKIRLVYRNFPLSSIHKNAQLAAQAGQAAALQGKFWQMHDKLFEGQKKWQGMSSQGAQSTFREYAQSIGLDVSRWERDQKSSSVASKVKADYDGGIAAGVDSTPTFFVNGKRMPQPRSYDEFKQYLIDALPRP
jgi:protein-disulfide isomerase